MTRYLYLAALLTACTSTSPTSSPAPEPVAVDSVTPDHTHVVYQKKLEHPAKVKAGDRFPVVFYAPRGETLTLLVDGKPITPKLVWSCRHNGSYVYTVVLHKTGKRVLEVKNGDKSLETSAIEVK